LVRFVLLPFVLALPTFRVHQHIANSSTFGGYCTFGLGACLEGFALWRAAWAWAIGVVLCAAVLRAAIEVGTLLAVQAHPARAVDVRQWLERFAVAALYLGLPAWLLLRVLGS
jgi:apolipoprotein N-acyltransferase